MRVLKPGTGRFSISCTTLRSGYGSINKFMTDEPAEAEFPSCMEVFMPLDAARPLLEDLGFQDIVIDDSNSKMSVWDEVEKLMRDDVERELAHVEGILPDVAEAARVESEDAAEIFRAHGSGETARGRLWSAHGGSQVQPPIHAQHG